MKRALFLVFLLLPFAALAQSETCPRVWRSGDSLLTAPAPAIQWLRDGQAIPGANQRWYLPTEAGSYAVEASSAASPAFTYWQGYALAGYVFDELHRPVEGASVHKGAFTAMSDEKGRFSLWIDERKPETTAPVVLVVEKEGYWRNASRQYVSAFDTTETRIMLHTRRVTNRVNATKGGEMAYQGFTLQLPPNAVQTESGTPYNGTILLSVEGSTPSNPDFGLRMPGGSFDAIDANGNDVMLYSYGYLSAEMTTEGGEKLELRPEAQATLRFYLPWNETHRPDSVPLWHFNTETAIWEQEGWSVRNGSIYEGQVSHFSSWNCDYPVDRGTCKGRVVDCNDEPVKGGWVRVGQRHVVADSLGEYWSFVPGGITFDARAAVDTLREITIPALEERTMEDLTGRDFGGVAFFDLQSQTLSTFMSGNVPANLRLSIDGGINWTLERTFTGIEAAPNEVKLDGGCMDKLQVVILPKSEDCRKLSAEELNRETKYVYLNDALSAEKAYRLSITAGFSTDEWDWLLHLICLQYLRLSGNELISLPESISRLANLQALELVKNQLTGLPQSFGNLAVLQSLTLTLNPLESLPESFGNLAALQSLDLKENQLTSLPESFGNLVALQTLKLRDNQLSTLPESFGNLAALQSLDLSLNLLESLPESFGNLSSLKTLDIDYGPLTSLPESIGNLVSLQDLFVPRNQLTSLPGSISNLDSLRSLWLNENQLTVYPEAISAIPRLHTLNLSRNQLTSLPESIANLDSLRRLFITENQLSELPAAIGNLASLVELKLGKNNLENLPVSISRLDSLQTLYVNYNQLTSLPASIGDFHKLRELFLEYNQLTELPEAMGNLVSLHALNLSENQLTDLPASFANLAGTLRRLNLSYNNIPVERRAAIQAMLPNTRITW